MSEAESQVILLIEDEPDMIDLISEYLVEFGFKVVSAKKLSEATMKVTNQAYYCIIMDLRLEQGSGKQLVHYVRSDRNGLNYETPIIVLSAFVDLPTIAELKGMVQEFVTKPAGKDVILSKIKSSKEKMEQLIRADVAKAKTKKAKPQSSV